jgi:hypothetical protein
LPNESAIGFTSKGGRDGMKQWRRFNTTLLAMAACGTCHVWAQVNAPGRPEQSAWDPLPPPIHQPGELPPMPPPTEEQLQRGRELLDKLVYVIANVLLTDAAAVLNVFGFTELSGVEYPTHTDVGPKGKTSPFARTEELIGTGFSNIRVQPRISDPRMNVASWVNARLLPKEACISIDEVRRVFGPISSEMHSARVVTAHPVQRPKPLHGTGNLSFSSLKNPLNQEAGIVFGFEYQTCATDFSFNYRSQPRELNK